MKSELLEKIQSRGYWRINFRPLVSAEKLPTTTRCKEVVEHNALELRGWEYPAILQGGQNVERLATQQYFELSEEWEEHIEFWRMYKSGQFLHYLALREDWLPPGPQAPPGGGISVVGAIFSATEIYEFLSRLSRAGLYDEGVTVDIQLNGTMGRRLYFDSRRVGFSYERKTGAEHLEWRKTHTKEEVLEKSAEISRTMLREWFDAFQWQASDEVIAREQNKLLSRDLWT